MRKPVFRVFDKVLYKPGCTSTEDGKRLEILDLESRGIDYLCSKNKGADQLHSNCAADLSLCFTYGKNRFSHDAAQMAVEILDHVK